MEREIYFKFIKANNWISKYYPNFITDFPKEIKRKSKENLIEFN